MKQEELNEMMRHPWERIMLQQKEPLPKCPSCGFSYLGNGVDECLVCVDESLEGKND
ncbi:hypothetical protein CASP1_00042 [Alcaligenes phage CASP1]|nr:hypothetical protein CASP1_00042 [Alcaligenes phage CASP1]